MSQSISSSPPRLSIIIPARNEADRLPPTLEKIADLFSKRSCSAEVIVVDNGSTDGTSERAMEFAGLHPELPIRVIVESCPGKGAAVRTGMLEATGEILFLCDADLSMPIEELEKFLKQMEAGADIAIGCRVGTGASCLGEPLHRRLMGRCFNLIVRLFGLTELTDTQCGFKAFRRSVAHDLFAAQTLCGWSFDVEILSIARQRGYSVVPVPITWNYDSDSRVRPFRDSIIMLREIWGIRARLRCGFYDRLVVAGTAKTRSNRPRIIESLGGLRKARVRTGLRRVA